MTDFPDELLYGYAAFRSGRLPQEKARYQYLAETGQRPTTMIVGCCDSRAAPETIFDAAPGELFVMRNVANLVPTYHPDDRLHGTSSAIEFAVTVLEVRHLVVMGHGRCGGIANFLALRAKGGVTGDFIASWIRLIEPAQRFVCDEPEDPAARQQAYERASIRQSLDNLMTFPWIADRVAAGRLSLHGAWFDISDGDLWLLDRTSGEFRKAGM